MSIRSRTVESWTRITTRIRRKKPVSFDIQKERNAYAFIVAQQINWLADLRDTLPQSDPEGNVPGALVNAIRGKLMDQRTALRDSLYEEGLPEPDGAAETGTNRGSK